MPPSDYLPRIADRQLEHAIATFPIAVIDGPRAVGKTTSALRLAKSSIRLPEDLPLLAIDPKRHLAGLEPPTLIDEWQLAGTDLLWTLKQLVDDDPTPGRFLLAGSVEPATYGPTYPLTGRAARIVMRPMTESERRGSGNDRGIFERLLTDAEVEPARAAQRGEPLPLADLFTTGFPGARHLDDPALFLTGYAALIAQRAGDEGRDASRLYRTLEVLATLTAQATPDQRIWDAADINKATWKAYDDLLGRTHLTTPVAAHSTNALKRLTSYPKRFLADTALALALAKVDPTSAAEDPTRLGPFLESHVVQQLRPHADLAHAAITHVRTSGGSREVDLLVDGGSFRVAFEVKAKQRPTDRDALALTWLHDELGSRLDASFVAHTGTDAYRLTEHTWAIPITAL